MLAHVSEESRLWMKDELKVEVKEEIQASEGRLVTHIEALRSSFYYLGSNNFILHHDIATTSILAPNNIVVPPLPPSSNFFFYVLS